MATCSDGGFLTKLLLVSLTVLLFAKNGAAYMPMMPMHGTDGVDSCETICVSAFTDSKVSDESVCKRGCRLMSMISMMGSEENSMDNLRDSCYTSCKEAYSDNESEGACAFGCQSQLPATEERRKQMSAYHDSHMSMMSALSSLHSYGRRMIDCMHDYFAHQVRVGWYIYGSADDKNSDGAAGGKMTVVVASSSSDDIDDTIGDTDVERPVATAGVVGAGADGGDTVVEHKTSNYLETNLAMVDRAATPNVRSSLFDIKADHLDVAEPSHVDDDGNDWLYCLERRTGTSKKVMLMIFVISLLLIMYVCVSAMMNVQNSPNVQKLTFNGDLRYLTALDDKEFLIKMAPQDSDGDAPALPMKIPVQVA
jgi:hypothetical protein